MNKTYRTVQSLVDNTCDPEFATEFQKQRTSRLYRANRWRSTLYIMMIIACTALMFSVYLVVINLMG